jgi:solute carrier family 36 (proton-coupled amino acid transporter)
VFANTHCKTLPYPYSFTLYYQVCIGAGVLALPYAIEKGGLLVGPIAIAAVAAWNAVACRMMIECKNATAHLPVPRGMSSTYSTIAYHGAGYFGVYLTDFSLVVTLLGVCIAFQITFSTLLEEIPFVNLSKDSLLLLSLVLLTPVIVVRDVSKLSIFSLAGLVCLIVGIVAILSYGSWKYGHDALINPFQSPSNIDTVLTLWPTTLSDASAFFGVATFCFGLCSMAFPIEESMAVREDFGKAVFYSLLFVWFVYAVIGNVGAILFIHDPTGIKDNILRNLPANQAASSIVNFSMALVRGWLLITCLFTS